jgi:hypothetical protein
VAGRTGPPAAIWPALPVTLAQGRADRLTAETHVHPG